MGIKFSNNASANIIQDLTSTATSVSVTVGKGDLFPSITEGDYFYATLAGNNGLEIVKVTNRVNDTMTIVRAQDNTTALSFDTGDLFELRIVAADFNDTFSEVNDKLEASIEETTSIVNSALSSKAPLSHASSSTEYGAGSSEQYGHLKSHDEPDAAKTAATGHAFSPAGAAAMQAVLEGQIDDLTGMVSSNATSQAAKDAEQDAAIAEALGKVGLPLGFEYVRLTGQTAPLGGVDYMGQTSTRAMYADLWAWLNENKPDAIISESEWQSLYSSQNGNVAKYSSGDGSTTFRFPRVVGYFKGAGSTDELGQYIKEGLPNLTGNIGLNADRNIFNNDQTGVFSRLSSGGRGWAEMSSATMSSGSILFDASRSNSIYGNSLHVTPESAIVVMGVIAFGSVASIGEATEEGIVAELGELGATKADASELVKYLPLTGGMMSGLIRSSEGDFILSDGDDKWISLKGGSSNETGASLVLYGQDHGGEGDAVLVAKKGTTTSLFRVSHSGGAFIDGSRVVDAAYYFAPNYNAGVSMGTTFTAPSSGIVNLSCADYPKGNSQITVNGVIATKINIPEYVDRIQTALVRKGDSVTATGVGGVQTVTFYPFRGA